MATLRHFVRNLIGEISEGDLQKVEFLKADGTIVRFASYSEPATQELQEQIQSARFASEPTTVYTGLDSMSNDAEYDNGNSGSAATIDFAANGKHQKITLTDDCDLTITPPVSPGEVILKVVQSGVGGFSFTWPANHYGPGGAITTGAAVGNSDILRGYFDGTITHWFVQVADSQDITT